MLNNDRQQGELLKWFEKFGYGFIRSHNSSEPDVFVHVSQFPSDIIPDIGAKVSFVIGKPFKGGVFGGLQPMDSDFGCLPIDSSTGAGSSSGDIQPIDTLAAFAMTVATGVGVDASVVQSSISSSPTYMPEGGGTAKIIQAALA